MNDQDTCPLESANGWTLLGTVGYFASSFPYITEFIAQLSQNTAESLGCDTKKLSPIFGAKTIGDVASIFYITGFSVALIVTIGFCYAVFHQLLYYQNNEKKKDCKTRIDQYLNLFATISTFFVVNIWISGAALTIFLLFPHFSLITKTIVIWALCITGIVPGLYYSTSYKQTLPGPILATETNTAPKTKENKNLETKRNETTEVEKHELSKTQGNTPQAIEQKQRLKIEDILFNQNITNIIFSCAGCFCNTYFVANLIQIYILCPAHYSPSFAISIFAWVLGGIFGSFFTFSAVYLYPIIFPENDKEVRNNNAYQSSSKHITYLPLLGFACITMLEILFPIFISLTYISGGTKDSTVVTVLYIAAAFLAALCTISPVKSAKIALDKHNGIDNQYNDASLSLSPAQ